MGQDLRNRLRRIREARREENAVPAKGPGKSPASRSTPASPVPAFGSEWSPAGFFSFQRTVWPEPSPDLPLTFPGALDILIPDLLSYGRDQRGPEPSDLLFFDLETTGLSGGAGTAAFLAAFGRFVRDPGPPGKAGSSGLRLGVTQYLLSDYPGEGDFLAAALAELEKPAPSGRPPLIVSYNGKTFDAQILKTRCLMNGLRPPEYYHADLLHPARRLWKRVLPGCSQGEIETAILGIHRAGDIPGAMAPEIWFSFLKTGETGELFKICDHNIWDIGGLAALFAALARIAEDPAAAPETYRVDLENLALHWFFTLRRRGSGAEQRRGEKLLAAAADNAYPKAAYVWARELIRRGKREEGVKRLSLIINGDAPGPIKAAAYQALAIDAEWRLDNPQLALEYVDLFLAPEHIYAPLHKDMQKRRERLLRKKDTRLVR